MMQIDWHDPSRRLIPFHLEEAMERSRLGLPGLVLSAAVGFATLTGIAVGIVTPAPAREVPALPAHQWPGDECTAAELACTNGPDLPTSSDLRAELPQRRLT